MPTLKDSRANEAVNINDNFDPTQFESRVGGEDTFDPHQFVDLVASPPKSGNSGVGAALGAGAVALKELVGPGKAKALNIATSGNRADKIKHALSAEGEIGRGALIGDLGETSVRALASGNLPIFKEAATSALKEVGLSLGLGLPLRGVSGGFNKLTFRPSATQSPEVNLAYDVFGEAMAKKGYPPLTLAAATESPLIDTLDNVSRAAIGSAGTMTRFDTTFDGVANTMLNIISDRISPKESTNSLVKNLFDVIMHQEQIGDIPAIVMRQTATRQADDAGIKVSMKGIESFVQKNVDDIDALGGFGAAVSGVTTSKALLNITDNPTVTNMLQLRSIAKATIRSLEADKVTATTPQVGMFQTLAKLSDQALKKALKEYDDTIAKQGQGLLQTSKLKAIKSQFGGGKKEGLLQILEKSDKDFALFHEKFFNAIQNKIKKSIQIKGKGSPGGLVDLMLKPERKNSLQFITSAKMAWPASEWPRVQRAAIERIRDKLTAFGTKTINGEEFAKMFSAADDFGAPDRVGRESLETIFGKDLTNELTDLANTIFFVQKKNPTNVGAVAVSISQGGGIIGAGADILEGRVLDAMTTLGVVIGLPNVSGRLLVSPTIVKAFTKGLKMSPNNPAWLPMYARIVSAVKAAQAAERRENPPPRRTALAQPTLTNKPQSIAIQQ